MATAVKLYKRSAYSYYFTAEAVSDWVSQGNGTADGWTEKDATRYDITIKAIDPASCTLWYCKLITLF